MESGPDSGEQQRAEDLLVAMLTVWAAEPSSEVRWQVVAMLADVKKPLQGVTVRGLLPDDGSRAGLRSAARRFGITPGWASQLVDAADAVAGERSHASWGRALGVAGVLAAMADAPRSTRHRDSHAELASRGRRGLDVRAELDESVSRWARNARSQGRGPAADVLVERFTALLDGVGATAMHGWLARVQLELGYHLEIQAGAPGRTAR